MPPKQTPPFRAEHVGSLLRPPYLFEARNSFERREISKEQLQEVEDRAIAEAINLQREVGLRGFTDGEYRRHIFFDGFFEHLEGMKMIENAPLEIFKPYIPSIRNYVARSIKIAPTVVCTGKIRHVESGYIPQFEVLKKLVHPDEVKNIKVTIVTPGWLYIRHGEHAFAGVYDNREDYFNDIAIAYQKELEVLYAAGCRNVQIDDPNFAYFCDELALKGWKDDGVDANALLDAYIQLYNDCLKAHPRDMIVGLHVCRGNYKSIHFAEGGYDAIAKKLFNELNVDCYYLEYDTPRSGSFEPLKYLPEHKSVVLGLVTSKFPELEDKEQLKERVSEAVRAMTNDAETNGLGALERICISPQCGFASHEDGNLLTATDMRRKLELVKEVAMGIWTDA